MSQPHEQARLAAEGSRDAALHTYHSEQREKAARCIQGFLQRQQLQQGADEPMASPKPLYSEDQLKCIRRAQRAFREHVRKQEADAQELHKAMQHASAISEVEHSQLCDILKQAARGEALSVTDRERLARLQHAFRETLSRKIDAANTVQRFCKDLYMEHA